MTRGKTELYIIPGVRHPGTFRRLPQLATLLALGGLACSPTRFVEGSVADALAATGDTFQSDDDPQLVASAVPFGLKVMESLLADLPRHQGLLLAACSGFASYGYAFVLEDADETPVRAEALAGRERARRLFQRAHGYCLRGLEVAHPGLADALLSGDAHRRELALAEARAEDVPLLYWSAVSWSLLIANSLASSAGSMELVGQLPASSALADRALALDPGWNEGTLFDFFVSLDAARGVDQGGGPEKAKAALAKSLELSGGTRLGPLVSYAEGVLVPAQDRAAFAAVLDQVLKYDADQPRAKKNRLSNALAQRRARWLKTRIDDLFL